MGLLTLHRLMSMHRKRQRRRRRRRILAPRNASIALMDKRKGDSQAAKIMRYSIHDLPEDMWHHIHSLMPLRDAARAACVSRAFLHSWRCRPNLILNRDILRSKTRACRGNFSDKIDRILRNHSGIGVKILKLELDGISCRYLDSWLQFAVTPGIEKLMLLLFRYRIKYNFPCSILSDGIKDSIRHLELGSCAFRPTAELGPLRSLTSLYLRKVRITGDELECLLASALALEQLGLSDCREIICLKIPCVLQQLSSLMVLGCCRLQLIDSKATNLSNFFLGGQNVRLSLGETLHMKDLTLKCSNAVYYARAKLPSIMPNLDKLFLASWDEVVNTPMLPTKFLYLKHLTIHLRSG
ncbi:hypothetical protein ACP4OV_016734 [Aristida adscensionis]